MRTHILVVFLFSTLRFAESGGVYQVELTSSSPILDLCTAHAYSPQLSVAAAATQLLTQLAVSCHQEAILLPDVDILSEAMQVSDILSRALQVSDIVSEAIMQVSDILSEAMHVSDILSKAMHVSDMLCRRGTT
jgi:hypothetical protein